MKIKALLATLVGAVAINGATAGEWCAPAPDKCPVECCPDSAGSISIGYDTDYIFYGVRVARDNIWADVNYTFDQLPVPITVGVWHLTSLASTPDGLGASGGDETDLYASIALPSIMGLDANIGYTHYLFSNLRAPGGPVGDSTGEVSLGLSTEVMEGISIGYRVAYDFNQAAATAAGPGARSTDEGAWIHTLSAGGTFDVTDCIGLALEAGVLYTDNYWTNVVRAGARDTGWNNYYLKAGLAIALNCNATLTPYIGYSGSPDGWVADGANAVGSAHLNANDVFHWGVSLGVDF